MAQDRQQQHMEKQLASIILYHLTIQSTIVKGKHNKKSKTANAPPNDTIYTTARTKIGRKQNSQHSHGVNALPNDHTAVHRKSKSKHKSKTHAADALAPLRPCGWGADESPRQRPGSGRARSIVRPGWDRRFRQLFRCWLRWGGGTAAIEKHAKGSNESVVGLRGHLRGLRPPLVQHLIGTTKGASSVVVVSTRCNTVVNCPTTAVVANSAWYCNLAQHTW